MKILITIIIILVTANFALFMYLNEINSYSPKQIAVDYCNDDYANQIYCQTNNYRIENNLDKLSYSIELTYISKQKSDDMCERKYFSHDYEGRSWVYFIQNSDIVYLKAGENLAKGYDTASEAMQALINSPTHKDNIIGDYTHIGVYTAECGGINYTTQTFAKL